MKLNRHTFLVFILMIVTAGLYRAVPYLQRPEWLGAPQLALAIFAGAVAGSKKWAFSLPLFAMLFSDILMQVLHTYSSAYEPGFYKGQLLNYVLILSVTVIGFFISNRKPSQVFAGLLAGPTVFFLTSNFCVWVSGGGWGRSKTLAGMAQCYADALPFYYSSLTGTVIFGTALFGIYNLTAAVKPTPVKA